MAERVLNCMDKLVEVDWVDWFDAEEDTYIRHTATFADVAHIHVNVEHPVGILTYEDGSRRILWGILAAGSIPVGVK